MLCLIPMPDPLHNHDQDLADPNRNWRDLQLETEGQVAPGRMERDSAEGYSELPSVCSPIRSGQRSRHQAQPLQQIWVPVAVGEP
jgi:hypothetical protein